MDQFDRATEIEERDRAHALAARKPVGPAVTGVCLFCEESLEMHLPVEERTKRWCDARCRDLWQRRQEQRR